MSLSSYSELQVTIENWLNQPAVAQDIPAFIALAEAQANRELRHWRMEKQLVACVETPCLTLPDDWLETLSLNLHSQRLEYVSRDNILEMTERGGAASGPPKYYTFTAGELEMYPSPTEPTTVVLTYVQRIPSLSDAAPTNWLLQTFPEVYLYGSLLHSAPYLQDDNRLAVWVQLYADAVQKVNADSWRAKAGGSNMRLKVKGLS